MLLRTEDTQKLAFFTESVVEDAALEWLDGLGYTLLHGPDIAPDGEAKERKSYSQVVLTDRLDDKLRQLNPGIPPAALLDARKKLLAPVSQSLVVNNRAFHRMLVEGVTVEFSEKGGTIKGARVRVVDFENPDANEFLAINQYTVKEIKERRPDVVLFLNGLPIAVIELKNAADPGATIWKAFDQLQTCKLQIPSLFLTNGLLVISDGTSARIGSLTSDKERFLPWRTIEGEELAPASLSQLEVLLRGAFEKSRILDLLYSFTVYEGEGEKTLKKIAGYHQFHAVRTAVAETVKASGQAGDRRGGVVWHTQGSGKSLTMAFYAAKIAQHPAMANPTLVVLTDRNDLDDQLFGTFSACSDLLRQTPIQATSRDSLQSLLRVAQGGVVFTTIQKFSLEEKGTDFPQLTDRRNVVVIADEAHRSQYDFIDGFARHLRDALPAATFIGFTGTPIEQSDRSTKGIFGEYISVYDIQRAVQDGATVPIYYEGRLAKLALSEDERPKIDPEFEEVTEQAEATQKEAAKRKWAQLEAMVGTPRRLQLVAADLVTHFQQRREAIEGKGMVVAMSRRIAVALYDEIVKLRPEWHTEDDKTGAIKVVMTGSASDPLDWQGHIRNKSERDALAQRLKDPADPLKLVIVRDMWLTGFDAPCLHTLYVDKPMKGHSLMQAIARVNRVFKDKPGGLVVDYIGIADELKGAMAEYTRSGGKGDTVLDQGEAVELLMEKLEVCSDIFHGFDWSKFHTGTPSERLSVLPLAQEHILARDHEEPGIRDRFMENALAVSRAFALAVAHDFTLKVRDDVAFFQAVRAALWKKADEGDESGKPKPTNEEINHAVRQIVSRSVISDEVVDIFSAAGLQKPDVSILSDEFLAEVQGLPYKNLAVEALRKLLEGEIKSRARGNVVQSKQFSEMLEAAIRKYQNRGIETAQVIQELIDLAKEMRAAKSRGEELGLTSDEVAFYDALEVNDSAVKALGADILKIIARELVKSVRENVSVDWTVKETARAKLRAMVKRVLRKHGYPPDKQEKAVDTVIQQAEVIAAEWA
jgi:type I restriction enzyme R subunit